MLPIILGSLGLALVAISLYRALSDPLRDVPGPFLSRFTRLWELFKVRQYRFEEVNIELHRKYGPVVRLAPGRYSISDPDASSTIYAHGAKLEKSSFYKAFAHPLTNESSVFATMPNGPHSTMRRQVAGLYSLSTMLSYEQFVDNQTDVLCQKLRSFAASGTSFDVLDWMQFYAFDVIGEITVGAPFGMMEAGTDVGDILKGLDEGSLYASQVGLVSEWHYWIGLVGAALSLPVPIEAVYKFLFKHKAARETGLQTTDRADFLAKLLDMSSKGKVPENVVHLTMLLNIAAGSDTTGITLSSVAFFLHQNPHCLARLREEIDGRTAAGKLSDPVRYEEASTMPYLQAVIKESLRLHPALGQPLPRVIPAGGLELCGRYFPAGSVVGVNAWVLHHNKAAYGPDADQFRPERWLGPHEEVAQLERNLLTFGAGARVCLGRNISMLEMTKAVPQLYRQFDFVMDASRPHTKKNTFFVKSHFSMTVKERSIKV